MIPAGPYRMGYDGPQAVFGDGEGPEREVWVAEFAISATAVSNGEFAEFVDATGHVTDAERFGWSFVFRDFVVPGCEVVGTVSGAVWWAAVAGATWKTPEGPGSTVEARLDHPVLHVSWNDAVAYCAWSGSRLPTEAEWEKAARGGLDGALFPWGNEVTLGGIHRCNIWQGRFPVDNTIDDGYLGTAPVAAFPPNGFGLYNMVGNVWEWCADWWDVQWHRESRHETRVDPTGPLTGATKVMRGGSYLCHDSYCNRYRTSARTSATPDSTTAHTGFRTAAD